MVVLKNISTHKKTLICECKRIILKEEYLILTNNVICAMILDKLVDELYCDEFTHVNLTQLRNSLCLDNCIAFIKSYLDRLVKLGYLEHSTSPIDNTKFADNSVKNLYKINIKNLQRDMSKLGGAIRVRYFNPKRPCSIPKSFNSVITWK